MRVSSFAVGMMAVGIVSAQPVSFSGPVAGLVFDAPTGSVRAIFGFPGSATFGPTIMDGLDFGSVAPNRNYALAFQSGNCLLLAGLDSGQAAVSQVSDVAGMPEGIVWSADGTRALLYSRSGNWVQAITGLPDAPSAAALFDVSTLGGSLSAVASDRQGKQIALGITGAAAGVYWAGDSQSYVPVFAASSVTGLSFSTDARSIYALDTAAVQLAVIDLASFGSQLLPLDGVADPIAIQADRDAEGRSVVYVAARSDQLLRVIDASSQQVIADVSLNIEPTTMDVLGHNSFVVASRSRREQPLWLLTIDPQPAVYFVPAALSSTGGIE